MLSLLGRKGSMRMGTLMVVGIGFSFLFVLSCASTSMVAVVSRSKWSHDVTDVQNLRKTCEEGTRDEHDENGRPPPPPRPHAGIDWTKIHMRVESHTCIRRRPHRREVEEVAREEVEVESGFWGALKKTFYGLRSRTQVDGTEDQEDGCVLVDPSVIAFHPVIGPREGGTVVTIHGTLFDAPLTISFVTREDQEIQANAVLMNQTVATVLTPPTRDIGEVRLFVRLSDGTVLDVPGSFHYYETLDVLSIDPSCGPMEGQTAVTLHSSVMIAPSCKDIVCSFGSAIVRGQLVGGGKVVCSSPPIPKESLGITRVLLSLNRGQHWSSHSQVFTYYGLLEEGDDRLMTPLSGPVRGGTPLSIGGRYFVPTGVPQCRFSFAGQGTFEVEGEVKPLNADTDTVQAVVCHTPRHSLGIATVSFSLNGRQWTVVPARQFVYYEDEDARILDLQPRVIPNTASTVIVLSVQHIPQTPDMACLFGDVRVPTVSVQSNQIKCVAPRFPSEAGIGVPIRVQVAPNGVQPIQAPPFDVIFFNTPVHITHVDPLSGPSLADESFPPVLVQGIHLVDTGAIECRYQRDWEESTEIDLDELWLKPQEKANSHSTADTSVYHVQGIFGEEPNTLACPIPRTSIPGRYTLEVSLDGGRTFTTDAFPFLFYPVPLEVTSMDPVDGPQSGGTRVTLTGHNFVDTGTMMCHFGSQVVGATVARSLHNVLELICVAPPVEVGTESVPVRVSLNGRDTIETNLRYSYYMTSPASALPESGPTTGLTVVTIIPSESQRHTIGDSVTCRFGDAFHTVPGTRTADGNITCTSPPAQHGPISIDIAIDGVFTVSAPYYYFHGEVVLTGLSPFSGPMRGGTRVTLSGRNLGEARSPVITAKFGDSPILCDVVPQNVVRVDTLLASLGVEWIVVCISPEKSWSNAEMAVPVEISLNAQQWTRSGLRFTYYEPPAITSIEPRGGPLHGGYEVSLYGGSTMFLGGENQRCRLQSAAEETGPCTTVRKGQITRVVCTVPPRTSPGSDEIELALNGQQYDRTGHHLVSYAVSPVLAPTGGGSTVHVLGDGFPMGDNFVIFGDDSYVVEATFINTTTLVCFTPSHKAGTVSLRLILDGLGRVETGLLFTFFHAPHPYALWPTSGPLDGGSLVEIYGERFVTSGTISCRFGLGEGREGVGGRIVDERTIACLTPPGDETQTVPVSVSVNDQDFFSTSDLVFTYFRPWTQLHVSPTSSSSMGGTIVSILGEPAPPIPTSDLICEFGNEAEYAVPGAWIQKNVVACRAPPHFPGIVSLRLSLNGQHQSPPVSFYFFDVFSIRPSRRTIEGNVRISALGEGFTEERGGLKCRFGGKIITEAQFISSRELSCMSPPSTAPGQVTVEVTTNSHDFAGVGVVLEYYSIEGISVTGGPITGGTRVTFTGSGFRDYSSKLQCRFGVHSVPATYISAREIVCTSPRVHIPQTVLLRLNMYDEGAFSFSYFVMPTFTGIDPHLGPVWGGGTNLTISGSGFSSGDAFVIFGEEGKPVRVTWLSEIALSCTLPPGHRVGEVPVWISFHGGEYYDTHLSFRYYRALARRTRSGLFVLDAPGAHNFSSSFFVWLSLSPERFWVNLNPKEPKRIIDPVLARSDAGHILVDSDFRLKKTVSRLIHPDTALGARYWTALYRNVGMREVNVCLAFRQWILSGNVTLVEEADGSLVLQEALLDVQQELEYLQASQEGDVNEESLSVGCPPEADPVMRIRGELLFKRMILPALVRRVNTAQEYESLRSIFYWRVLAEYVRRKHPMDEPYASFLGKGDIRRWISTDLSWNLHDIYRAYVKSIAEGEFRVEREEVAKDGLNFIKTYYHGAIDFTRVDL